MIQSLYAQKSTDTNRYGHNAVHIQMMVTSVKSNDYSGTKTIRFALDFHTINQHTSAYLVRSLLCRTSTL